MARKAFLISSSSLPSPSRYILDMKRSFSKENVGSQKKRKGFPFGLITWRGLLYAFFHFFPQGKTHRAPFFCWFPRIYVCWLLGFIKSKTFEFWIVWIPCTFSTWIFSWNLMHPEFHKFSVLLAQEFLATITLICVLFMHKWRV